MLLRNQRWDVALKSLALLLLTGMLALSLRNFAYGFSDPEPLVVPSPGEIVAGAVPEDRYVGLTAAPRLDRVQPHFRYGIWYYYFPVAQAGGRLYVRDYAPPQAGTPVRLAGRLQRFASVPFAAQVGASYRETFGEEVPGDAWIVLQGDTPEAYQVAVYADVPLVFLWLVDLYLLIRGLQGKPALPGRRRLAGT